MYRYGRKFCMKPFCIYPTDQKYQSNIWKINWYSSGIFEYSPIAKYRLRRFTDDNSYRYWSHAHLPSTEVVPDVTILQANIQYPRHGIRKTKPITDQYLTSGEGDRPIRDHREPHSHKGTTMPTGFFVLNIERGG